MWSTFACSTWALILQLEAKLLVTASNVPFTNGDLRLKLENVFKGQLQTR